MDDRLSNFALYVTIRETEGFCIANLQLTNCNDMNRNEYGNLWRISFSRIGW